MDIGSLVVDIGISAKYDQYLAEGVQGRLNKDVDMSSSLVVAKYINVEEEPSDESSTGVNATISERMNAVLAAYKPGSSYFTKNGKNKLKKQELQNN